MKVIIIEMKIPDWALPYLVNGVTDNLSQEDLQLVTDFESLNNVESVNPKWNEPYFSHSNDVGGLACNVFDCDVVCRIG